MKITFENIEVLEIIDEIRKLSEKTAKNHMTTPCRISWAFQKIDYIVFSFFELSVETVFEILGIIADVKCIQEEEAATAFNIISHEIILECRNGKYTLSETEFKEKFLEYLPYYMRNHLLLKCKGEQDGKC